MVKRKLTHKEYEEHKKVADIGRLVSLLNKLGELLLRIRGREISAPMRPHRTPRAVWWQSPAWAYIVAFAVVFGLTASIATLYATRPIPSLSPFISVNPSEPYSTWFTLMNNGQVAMRNVTATCIDNVVTFEGGEVLKARGVTPVMNFKAEQVGSGDRVNLPCPRFARLFISPSPDKPGFSEHHMVLGDAARGEADLAANLDPSTERRVTRADISLVLEYSIIFGLPHIQREFRFETTRTNDGSFIWLQIPLDTPFPVASTVEVSDSPFPK